LGAILRQGLTVNERNTRKPTLRLAICLKFYNEKMKKWYDEANTEKKEVEEFRQNSKSDLEGGDDFNRLFQ
jgi:hypothetical protein